MDCITGLIVIFLIFAQLYPHRSLKVIRRIFADVQRQAVHYVRKDLSMNAETRRSIAATRGWIYRRYNRYII